MAETLLDDFSPAYRRIQAQTDAARWQTGLAAGRRLTSPQTPDELARVAQTVADEYGVDPRLVHSIMGVESGGQSGVISRKGAVGVMQLMPATAQRFGVRDPLDPVQNIEGGVRYLAWLRDQFPGRTDLQVAAYHAGEGAVRHAGYQIPQTTDGQMTTPQYVQTVLGRYQPTLPGEAGTAGLDLTAALARQAVRENQPGPELTLPPTLSPYAHGVPHGSALPGQRPLPGEAGTSGLTLGREAERYPMQLQTPLTVETSPEVLAQRTAGQPTVPRYGQTPWSPERWQEPGLEESLGGQLLGDVGVGLLQSWEALLQGGVALQTQVGLNLPVPGLPDPMGLQLLIPSLQQAVQETQPVRGSRAPNVLDTLANGIGSSLTGIMLGMGSQAFFSQVGKVVPLVANLAGATASGVTEALQEAGGVYEQMAPLVGQDEAARRAMQNLAWNTVLVTLSDKLSTYTEIPRAVTRTLLGVVTNGLQEAVQYELERHHLWVSATHPAAEDLVQEWGWTRQGDRVVKPFHITDMAEATLVGMVIGGAAAAAIGGPLPAWQQVEAQERQATGGTLAPQFSLSTAVEAAQFPDRPRAGIEPSTWQRWGTYLKDLVTPPPGFQRGVLGQTLRNEEGSLRLFRESGMAARLLPESKVRDDEGQLVRMYHGTSQAFGAFAPEKADPNALYGPGFYFTDSPPVTEGYATAGYSEHAREALRDLTAAQQTREYYEGILAQPANPATGVAWTAADRVATEGTIAQVRGQEARASQRLQARLDLEPNAARMQPNVRPVYLDIKNPFDVEKHYSAEDVDAIMQLRQAMSGQEVYDRLATIFHGKANANDVLRQAGYDGITHIGGAIAGGEPHRVYIAFRPEQVIPALQLEAQAVEPPARAPRGILAGERGAVGGETPPLRPGEPTVTPTPETPLPAPQAPGEVATPPPIAPAGPPPPGATPGVEPLQPPTPAFPEHVMSEERAVADQAQMTLTAARERIAFYVREIAQDTQQLTREGATMDPEARAVLETRLRHDQDQLIASREALQAAQEWQQTHQAVVDMPPATPQAAGEAGPLPVPPQAPLPPGATPGVQPLPVPTSALPNVSGTSLPPRAVPLAPGLPGAPAPGAVAPLTPAPTIQRGAEGLPRYRTESGALVRPLGELPSQELELQDFVRQQGGIRVQGEELSSELAAVVSQKETGTTGLQNNATGRSLQQMAEAAHEQGFIATPDTTALLEALDRSVTQRVPVFSTQATGTIMLLDDPGVRTSYQAVLEAARAMQTRTAEQVAGTRSRQAVHEEARAMIARGQFTPDDIREIYPNTTLNDTMASALVQSLNTLGEQMAVAAQQYLDGGARIGSREEARLQQLMGLFAELDPVRLGVSAAHARGLGILNDPLSAYTQYLNALHQTIAKAPATTMRQIAKRILAARPDVAVSKAHLQAHPDILADLFAEHYAMVERFQQSPLTPLEPGVQQALLPPQATFQPVDWDAVRAALDRMNALEPLDPLRNQIQQDLFSKLEGLQWDQPGADRLARYLAEHSTEDTLRTITQALQPWEGSSQQLALFQALAQTTKPGFGDYFLELWYNAMLSNPSTHLANIVGNTVSTLWAIPERFVASYYGRGGPGQVAHGEASAMLYGLVHGIQDAWAGALRSWQQGRPVSGMGKESTREPVWTAEHLGLQPGSPMARFMDFWFHYIGAVPGSMGRLPSQALMSVDEFFKLLNYRMELNALAFREATAQGLEGPAWREQVGQIVGSPTLPQLQQAAKDWSVLQAFQQPLGQSGFWGRMQGIAETSWRVPWTEQELPVGRLLLPFVQTPANLARWNLERLPVLGQLLHSYQADVAAGGARAELARAKVTMGSLALLGAAGLFLSGRLTGRGPEDPDLRARWLEAHPEYSVRLPTGTWLSLARFEPAGTLIGMTADFLQLMGEGQVPLMERIPIALFMTLTRGITSKTYMQSLSQFFDAVSPRPYARPEEATRGAQRFVMRQLTSMLQPSQVVAATARVLDPAEKETKNLVDALYARIPGWRNDVPSRRTLNGEKQLYGYGTDPSTLRLLARAYLPWQIADGTLNASDQEILTHHITVPPIPWSLGGTDLPEGMTIDDVDPVTASRMAALRLTARQHEQYAVLASGNQTQARQLGLDIPTRGLTELAQGLASAGGFAQRPPRQALSIGEYLDWMIQQPEYLDPNRMTDGPEGGKAKAILTAVKRYRDYGFALLLAQDDEVRQRYGTARLEQQLAVVPGAQRPGIRHQVQQQQRELGVRMREQLGLTVGGGAKP